jgi:hypothetical protein
LAARAALDVIAVFDVGQAIVKQREHGWSDFLTESITGAEILINPDLHCGAFLLLRI